jgi:putative transposase
MLAGGRYFYPLTVTDFASRYLVGCEALSNIRTQYAVTIFERLVREFRLPKSIRTDSGIPFASGWALFGLNTLSVWWLRLGIALMGITPGRPQQNGRHERMHLTLKKEATKPAGKNPLQQQARFDTFLKEFNHERHHQALEMKTPGELYRTSPRPYTGIGELEYPSLYYPWGVKHVFGVIRYPCDRYGRGENGGADGTRTRDPRRDRPVF